MWVGRLTCSPADALRARPATCGALGRASVNSDAANQRSPNDVDPFYREVPEPQEHHTQEGERQIERDIPAQGHVRRGQRQDAVEDRRTKGRARASAWDRSPISAKTGSTSARSPIGARCIAASTNRSSAGTCSRPCRRSAPPTPLTGRSGLEAQPLFSPAGSSTTAATE